mgnify:CR=1 FL=1
MVKVFFLCSSPFVGYTLKQADYTENQMLPVSEQAMTPLGYKIFNSSGSYMVLADVSGYRYFHTRQSQSEQYDEQGRRIYANIAFLGSGPRERETINKLAAYAFFAEDAFYKEMAAMITLLSDGFTIDFEKLSAFLKRFEKNCVLDAASAEAKMFFREITDLALGKEITFVLLEATWNYFTKQIGYDFHNSVKRQLSPDSAAALRAGTVLRFSDSNADTKKAQPGPPPEMERHSEQSAFPMESSDRPRAREAEAAEATHTVPPVEQQNTVFLPKEDTQATRSGTRLFIQGILVGSVLVLIAGLLLRMIGVL